MNSVAVIGAGAWGTALTVQAARAGAAVTLVGARSGTARAMRGRAGICPACGCPTPCASPAICRRADTNSRSSRCRCSICGPCCPCCRRGRRCCSRPRGWSRVGCLLPLEIAAELHPGVPAAFLTGPSFAAEVARGLPTACVIAAADPALRRHCAARLATPAFRLYGNADPVGAQVGARRRTWSRSRPGR